MMQSTVTPETDVMSLEDRKKLAGLLGFAEGVLNARTKVQMVMQTGMGVFHEGDLAGLPGILLDCEDGAWMRINRQRETRPPEPADYVAEFLTATPSDPTKKPQIKPAISIEVSIEDASDLEEAGLLSPEDVHPIIDEGIEIESRVKVVLHAENCPEMVREFDRYAGGAWDDWARQEKPVRRAISVYNDLFKIHSAIHTSEGTPPELVWGIGISRWATPTDRIDMPLIEQLVDIEIEDGGAISLRPRDLPPHLSLKPYLEIDIDGSPKLQRELQERLSQFLAGDTEFSPFTTIWEPLLDTAASNLSSNGTHVTREELDAGDTISAAGEDLRITSSWAIFGRPRSNEARLQDIQALRNQVDDPDSEIPASIKGYAAPPPDKPAAEVSDFGLNSAVLGGADERGWEPSPTGETGPISKSGAGSAAHSAEEIERTVHFFPLPFNEEQGRISDMIDDTEFHVVGVSGPPGTGKSHSIANIISHQMAMGKRVLVTARTPEAIAAVREKLPESLQPLVIASVGTDRQSAHQLQQAVTELSREVVSLNTDDAQHKKEQLERQIVECDKIAEKADRDLAAIARANLAQLKWEGQECTAMELVEILARSESDHGWFTDRPDRAPPAQLRDVLEPLRTTLPALAADIIYAGADLPEPDDLPTTAELIEAHETERAWNDREIVDYSSAPTMALDNSAAESQARQVLAELIAISEKLEAAAPQVRSLAICALRDDSSIGRRELEQVKAVIDQKSGLEAISKVRFVLGKCAEEEFQQAAMRGASGQKPVGFGLFNGALKSAVTSTRVDGRSPESTADWAAALEACRLDSSKQKILDALRPLVSGRLAPSVPREPWDVAMYLVERRAELEAALDIADRLKPATDMLRRFFPYGLDIKAISETLDCSSAIFAIRGNLPDDYVPPAALTRLREISGKCGLPVHVELGNLAGALGHSDTNPADIVAGRKEITQELTRLAQVSTRLRELGADLDALRAAGAPEWAERLSAKPDAADELIPATWQASWAWAQMKARVDAIVALGNGDEHRRKKTEVMAQRRRLFEELIRTRTLLGLKRRMTHSIRQAMEAFTQAISKIGTGRGKRAPRFIRAAQDAARQASAAAPVWIMPEYKIPEQLPAEFGDFDLVILDEASQSDITALAALARGKKILVVGDEEQVSPASVGIADQKINALRAEFLDGLPNAALLDQNSSIFEITKRMHPDSHVMLREHFRCVAPIIQFSSRFYNNSLVPLRVPKASERFDPPLADVYIPGATRQGKTNGFEARWIVDEIARLITDPAHDGRDIGVISLIGSEQAEKIGRMLVEDERIGPEQIEERRIIYGDARTMQGQERSIVFLSMVATPGHAQAQTRKADQQRINVAMSRAKDRLYLVRSVSLEDLNPNDIKAQILQHFADPMPEGRATTGKESDNLMDRCQSGFEREVLGLLLDANYRVRPQVAAGGFNIDLVVEGQEDRRLAIELDGDKYHGPDVWDRDMSRQAALERAGWVFWRVFGSQWRRDQDYWWRNLRDTLTRLGIEPIGAEELDERFTETILVDLWGDLAATDDEATAAGSPAAQVQQDDLHTKDAEIVMSSSSPEEGLTMPVSDSPATKVAEEASDHAHADAEHSTKPETASGQSEHDRDAVSMREKTNQRPRRHDLQPQLPLQDDLFELSFRTDLNEGEAPNGGLSEVDGARFSLAAQADANEGSGPVRVGSTVLLEKLGHGGGKIEITLVEQGHDVDRGMIGVHTALGQALLDAAAGDEVEYRSGPYLSEVRVLEVN